MVENYIVQHPNHIEEQTAHYFKTVSRPCAPKPYMGT